MPLGPLELGVIAAICLLVFGPRQIPKLGRSLGATIREFRNVGKELTDTLDEKSES